MRKWRSCLAVYPSPTSWVRRLAAWTWWASSISSAGVSSGTRPMVLRYQPIESALSRPVARWLATRAAAALVFTPPLPAGNFAADLVLLAALTMQSTGSEDKGSKRPG